MPINTDTQAFIMHCGEMGSRWGFNRTVGQICALLVITPEPISAEQIAEALSISRGNVSMGLKELQSWRLIQLSHKPGDRKEYFDATASIWEMAQTIFEERLKREVDPTLSLLRSQLLAHEGDATYGQQRLQEIHDLLELTTAWATALNGMQPATLQQLMKLGSGVTKVLGLKDKLKR
ncbi:GbsR/MarR family transcriptional regulator [Marinagarivorans algicola]|uniref:GbsR/MarR family transcriptional regulator n=1 Tax=Marinagarivorans algicola TaxID=1513270 RepID=UPI0006B9F368|nr:MarR family transcriptional regulator [Marinagarivorans algicola]